MQDAVFNSSRQGAETKTRHFSSTTLKDTSKVKTKRHLWRCCFSVATILQKKKVATSNVKFGPLLSDVGLSSETLT